MAAHNAALITLWGETHATYDIGNELLDPATLAEAILCDETEKLLE